MLSESTDPTVTNVGSKYRSIHWATLAKAINRGCSWPAVNTWPNEYMTRKMSRRDPVLVNWKWDFDVQQDQKSSTEIEIEIEREYIAGEL